MRRKAILVGTARLSPKYQITVPKRVREILGLDKGDIIHFLEEDGRIFIVKGPIEVEV